MTPPIAIQANGHETMLKWHRGRVRPGDTPFTAQRIAEGLAAAASIEIDLQITADGDLAVLHDPLLEQSTTGHGAVFKTTSAQIAKCRLLDRNHEDSGENVMLLADLAALVANGATKDGAVLQLDFKDPLTNFHNDTVEIFAKAVRPVADHMILSGGDAGAVQTLAGAVPGLPVGYDPCLDDAMGQAIASGIMPALSTMHSIRLSGPACSICTINWSWQQIQQALILSVPFMQQAGRSMCGPFAQWMKRHARSLNDFWRLKPTRSQQMMPKRFSPRLAEA